MTVFEEIKAERMRQIFDEGFTSEWDDQYQHLHLARGAACYAVGFNTLEIQSPLLDEPIRVWPWDEEWFKPSDTRRNLIKAAALIVAEIERLDRENDGN